MSKIHSNQLLINGKEKVGYENLKYPKAFIDYSQTIDGVYENLEDYNSTKKRIVLIVFDDMIAVMESNKYLSPKVTDFFHLFLYDNLLSKCLKL